MLHNKLLGRYIIKKLLHKFISVSMCTKQHLLVNNVYFIIIFMVHPSLIRAGFTP